MARHNEIGERGEEIAAEFLLKHGFSLLHRNWRSSHHELDIVAEWHGEIVFVEVKTRTNEDFLPAMVAVNNAKRHNLCLAARHYINYFHLQERPARFDVITVVGAERPYRIQHTRRAFSLDTGEFILKP